MSTAEIPEFTAGKPCAAADLNTMPAALRGIMSAQGPLTIVRRPVRTMHCFTRAGSAVARLDAEGNPTAVAAEILWQLGPHVALLPGGSLEGVDTALEQAATQGAPIGLHADVAWQRVQIDTYSATLEATNVAWSAAPWLEPEEAEDGSTEWYYHGNGQAGCILPAPGYRGQPQQALTMWTMPQLPLMATRQHGGYVATGSMCLLPAPACEQVLASNYGGYYTAAGDFTPVAHQWLARLDKHGRLHIAAQNLDL